MLSETITEGLASYQIGSKLKSLRLKKSMGLTTLASHTGLSPALLSKIERGQIFPTLPTLLRIAMVFGIGLENLFSTDLSRPMLQVVRATDRLRLPERPGVVNPAYYFESLNFPVTNRGLDAYFATFPAGAEASMPHHHSGTELLYVIRGQLVLEFADRTVDLASGDAAHFDCTAPHSYRQSGAEDCDVIVATVPA